MKQSIKVVMLNLVRLQGDVKKFKVYVKNPKGNVVKVNFGHKGKGGEKTMRIKKSDPARRKNLGQDTTVIIRPKT